jgi:foldase protein PrsA
MASKASVKAPVSATKKAAAKAPVKVTAKVAQKPSVSKVSVAKKAPVKAPVIEKAKVEGDKKPLGFKKSQVVLALAIVLVGAALYFLRSVFVAAVVNGQPISRLAVVKEAEKQTGKQTLSNLVRNSLIEQEAKKQNVTVSDKEINDEVKKLEGNLSKQGQKLEQVLSVQGMTRSDLNRLIRLDKLVAKMVGRDVKVSDKEVDEYLEKNKDLLPADQDQAALKKQVKERLVQQKTSEKVKAWLEDLQAKAKVIYFVQY